MNYPGGDTYLRSVVLSSCFVVAVGCHRQSSAAIEDDQAQSRMADSAKAALAERSRSSASQVVDFTDEERSRYTRVEVMIQSHFPGVQVVRNGGGYSLRIRGGGSFASSNEPLVLVDGVTRTTADLDRINTKDVARIEVVKDGAAAYYGVRGANGVIVITTRRTP